MGLLLKILGIVFIVVAALLLLGYFLIRWWWKRIGKFAGESLTRVELEEDPDAKWVTEPEVQKLVEEFGELGFKQAKVYKSILGGTKTLILTNEARDQIAGVYHTPQEVIAEFCAETVDGISLNMTNHALSELYSIKPNKIIEGCAHARPAELYEKFNQLISDASLIAVPEEEFTAYLQDSINKDIQQSYESNGRPLWQDGIEDYMKRWSKHAKEKNLLLAYSDMVGEHLQHIENEISESLEESDEISARVWTKYECSLFIYHPRFEKNGFCQYIEMTFDHIDFVKEKRLRELLAESEDTEQFFQKVVVEYPELKLEKIISVDAPIEADVYGYDDPDDN
ncbi:MAG: hypothetical protein QM496_03840 [Verrucomicrobiota bacterium]